MHGHQLRRSGELTNVEAWGGITGGALYRELHRLAEDGLIRPVKEEQVGRRPARTVYEITEEGRLELVVQGEAALQRLFDGADPVAVVLLFASGGDRQQLRTRLGERRAMVAAQLEALASERSRLQAHGYLDALAVGAFRRGEFRLRAELDWHDEFDRALSAPGEGPAEATS